MAYGAGLGAYHSGIEWELWKGPAACSGGGDGPGFATDAGALLESLSAGRIPSCADAPWRLLGLSLAGYNALICAALAIVAVTGAVAAHKRREQ
jgi:disulfide bond formation protein DsbB